MSSALEFRNMNQAEVGDLMKNVFNDKKWLEAFFRESHHGLEHGHQVKSACLRLIDKLNEAEQRELFSIGTIIDQEDPRESAIAATCIAAVFHDSGRINDDGCIIGHEQVRHHLVSADRASEFCSNKELHKLLPYVKDAVLSHDYQNKALTPHLDPPQTIVGKIVQSADQMDWFHPRSVFRTMNFCKSMGVPMYDPNLSLEERLAWVPAIIDREDALTVVLNQLFGPTDEQRFGLECVREIVESYKAEMEQGILKAFSDIDYGAQAAELMEQFRNSRTTLAG